MENFCNYCAIRYYAWKKISNYSLELRTFRDLYHESGKWFSRI